MSVERIHSILRGLSPSPSPTEFTVQMAGANVYLARSQIGDACAVAAFPPSLRLAGNRETNGLSLEFYPSFELRGAVGVSSVQAAVLRCREPALLYSFAVLVQGLVTLAEEASEHTVTPPDVVQYVEDWLDLFSRPRRLSPEEELGLWGELQFILTAPDLDGAINAWYGPEAKRFDFSANGIDLDVKISLRGHVHRFSLEQLLPSPSGSDRYIFSVAAQEDPAGGTTLSEQVASVRAAAADKMRLERKLFGMGYSESYVYDESFSVSDVRVISAGDVPCVHSVDRDVSQVHFDADVSNSAALTTPELATLLIALTRSTKGT